MPEQAVFVPKKRPPVEGGQRFRLVSDFLPAGDQPQAIDALFAGLASDERDQVLLGVTGSGKTFTIAHVIARVQRRNVIAGLRQWSSSQGEYKINYNHLDSCDMHLGLQGIVAATRDALASDGVQGLLAG